MDLRGMVADKGRAWLLRFAALLALGFALSFYGFFSAPGFAITLILAAIGSWFLDPRSFALLAGSLLFSTMLALAGLAGMAPRVQRAMIYRPLEQLQTYDPRWDIDYYRPNTDLRGFEMPFGDLVPLVPNRSRSAVGLDLQPRTVNYRIDDLGFRNDASYSGEAWILTGDSFVAGEDSDQPDTLSNQLRGTYGVRTYSVAHPGEPVDYVQLVHYFTAVKAPKDPRIILFLFEGNDFDAEQAGEPAPGERFVWERLRPLRLRQRETGLYRLTFSMFSRVKYDLLHFAGLEAEAVYVRQLGSHKIGFSARDWTGSHKSEADVAEMAARLATVLEPIRDRLAAIVFIPMKYRVYAPLMDPSATLPQRAWRITEQACVQLTTSCIDLTVELQTAARGAFEHGEKLLFWKDDTHWNRDGIAVAARVVRDVIQSSSKAPER